MDLIHLAEVTRDRLHRWWYRLRARHMLRRHQAAFEKLSPEERMAAAEECARFSEHVLDLANDRLAASDAEPGLTFSIREPTAENLRMDDTVPLRMYTPQNKRPDKVTMECALCGSLTHKVVGGGHGGHELVLGCAKCRPAR